MAALMEKPIAEEETRLNGIGEQEEGIEEGEILDDFEEESDSSASMVDPSKANTVTATPHLLEHSWTFWFDSPSAKAKQAVWASSIRSIYTFSTVEDFWSLYNNMHHPSKLPLRADFYCFKNKIEPKWEDPVCASGGKWTVTFPRGKSDTGWLYTLLAMIGEQFNCGDEICGAVVNVRSKEDKISIWTKNAADEATQMSIGKQWKEFLDYNDNIGFIVHDDAKKLDRAAKNRYTA